MGIFSLFKRRKSNTNKTLSIPSASDTLFSQHTGVQVLGFGDEKCDMLAAATAEALRELQMIGTVDRITDMGQIADHGIMITPALLVDGIVVSFGKVLDVNEISIILQKVR